MKGDRSTITNFSCDLGPILRVIFFVRSFVIGFSMYQQAAYDSLFLIFSFAEADPEWFI